MKQPPLIEEEIEWKGHKFLFEFFDERDYSNLTNITQVYGFIFNEKDEILIVKCGKDKDWSLPGGGPEQEDKTWKDTLIREVDEEADVNIENIAPAGYVKSTSLDKNFSHPRIGIAIRAVAKLKKIKPQTIDPAHGIIPKRKFIAVKDFLSYLPWGKNGKAQLDMALKVHKT